MTCPFCFVAQLHHTSSWRGAACHNSINFALKKMISFNTIGNRP